MDDPQRQDRPEGAEDGPPQPRRRPDRRVMASRAHQRPSALLLILLVALIFAPLVVWVLMLALTQR